MIRSITSTVVAACACFVGSLRGWCVGMCLLVSLCVCADVTTVDGIQWRYHGITPVSKPENPQIVPEGSIAVTKEPIAAPSAGTMKVVGGVAQLGVSIQKTSDLTKEKKGWGMVSLSADDVKVDDGKVVVSVPVDFVSGFMVI